jgi:hypothetical protein
MDKTCPRNDKCVRYTTDAGLAKTNNHVILVHLTLRRPDELLCERFIEHLTTMEEYHNASNNKIKY